jgi:hypothetical protein
VLLVAAAGEGVGVGVLMEAGDLSFVGLLLLERCSGVASLKALRPWLTAAASKKQISCAALLNCWLAR